MTPLAGEVGGLETWALNTVPAGGDLDGADVIETTPRIHVAHLQGGSGRLAAARELDRLGLGPAIVQADDTLGLLVRTRIDAPWRLGTLGRISTYGSIPAIVAARAAFREHAAAALPERDLVADIRAFAAMVMDAGHSPSSDTALLLDFTEHAAPSLEGGPAPRPSFGTAEPSSTLLHPDGRVLLLGGTFAGISDPLADIGLLVAELCPPLADADEIMLAAWGSAPVGALARVRIFAALADIRAALWALLAAYLGDSAHRNDFLANSGYRARRAAFAISDSAETATMLRRAADGWEA